jgi:hypothetical protein
MSGQPRRAPVLDELLKQDVVIDMRGNYVCLGTLTRIDHRFIELKDADIHDLRDTKTSREIYVVESKFTGIKRNRRRALVVRDEIVAISRLADVADK